MTKFTLHFKPFLILTLTFVAFTAIGTLSHEYGHILVAQHYGYETTLHYSSMNYSSGLYDELAALQPEDPAAQNEISAEHKSEYDQLLNKLQSHSIWIRVGGPLQTTLTGSLGWLFVYFRRKQIKEFGLKWIDWLGVFLSLFWLREVFNLMLSFGIGLISPNGSYFGGDESYISQALQIWEGTLSVILGTIGIMISAHIIFYIIPYRLRWTFMASGLLGGILGYIFWMNYLGPLWLP